MNRPPFVGARRPGRPRSRATRLTRPDRREAGIHVLDWRTCGESERERAWIELCAWTEWLTERYRLRIEDHMPRCWTRHPELIEELTALRAWHQEAHGRSAPRTPGVGQSATAWHQALHAFLQRTATYWAAGCRAGHKDLPEPDRK